MGVPMQTAKTRKKQPSPKMTAASRAAFCFCTKPLRLGGARYLQVHECRELAGRMLAVICGRRGYRQGPPWEDLATSVLQSTAGVAGTVISGTQVDPLPSPLTDRLFLQRCSVDARTCLRTSSSMTRRSSPKHRMRFEGPKRGVPGGGPVCFCPRIPGTLKMEGRLTSCFIVHYRDALPARQIGAIRMRLLAIKTRKAGTCSPG